MFPVFSVLTGGVYAFIMKKIDMNADDNIWLKPLQNNT